MKLIYLSNSILPSKSANSIHVMKMCKALAQAGADVKLIAPNIDKSDSNSIFNYYAQEQTFEIIKFHYSRLLPGQSKGIFYSILVSIYALFSSRAVYGRNILGCLFSSILGKAVILELHSPPSKFTKLERFLFLYLFKRAKIDVVVISNSLKKIIIDEASVEESSVGKIIILHDGADIPKLENQTDILDFSHEKKNIGYLGHLYPGRGVELIVNLAQSLPHHDFHIVGGLSRDIDYWKSQDISENVFFYGHVTPDVAEKYRLNMDLLLAPYQRKVTISGKGDTSNYMSPLKVFEYMASGTPFIISDLPVLHEVLSEDDCFFVDPEDENEWKFAIESVFESPVIAKKRSKNAFENLKKNYTWLKRAEIILRNY